LETIDISLKTIIISFEEIAALHKNKRLERDWSASVPLANVAESGVINVSIKHLFALTALNASGTLALQSPLFS